MGQKQFGKNIMLCQLLINRIFQLILFTKMYRGMPYMNKHVRRKEEERTMNYHLNKLTEIRPVTSTIDRGEAITINNKKGDLQKEARFTEIERGNRILLEKITSIMSKPHNKTITQLPRVNKSLNSSYRRKVSQNIEVENAKMLKRIQQKKATLNTEKITRQWQKKNYVSKQLSNYTLPVRDQRKTKTNFISHEPKELEISKIRIIDGISFLITIKLNSQKLQIIGDTKNKNEVKIIEIDRDEAIEFIDEECNGKLQRILDKLRYEKNEKILYLISGDSDLEAMKMETERLMRKNSSKQYLENNREVFQKQQIKVQQKKKMKESSSIIRQAEESLEETKKNIEKQDLEGKNESSKYLEVQKEQEKVEIDEQKKQEEEKYQDEQFVSNIEEKQKQERNEQKQDRKEDNEEKQYEGSFEDGNQEKRDENLVKEKSEKEEENYEEEYENQNVQMNEELKESEKKGNIEEKQEQKEEKIFEESIVETSK